ncbi:hypothetical protein R7Q10_02735 [Vibrio sp. Vb0599]|uniref:hypothetical protein n=1 Tax=Vibrio sp. Vb0599 TaxID=3074628 RepID=UPI0029647959|nr:hypothetical protein [Vibrio sp. Vb0599]MDW1940915.1 hypothetical protein [Vibrio sp. Vb0599]
MKLNQKETQAIETLQLVASVLKSEVGPIVLTAGEVNSVKDVLGIDLWQSTIGKKEVKTLIRGKEKVLLYISYRAGGQYAAEKHCYFPFQVKQRTGVKV